MSKLPCCDGLGVTSSEAMGEKQDMQALNNKLAYYIQWVRKLKSESSSASGSFSASSYSEGMKQLESELVRLKAMYESELQKLRASLLDANREKNKYAAEAGTWADLKTKLSQESGRVHSLELQIANYEKTIADKQKEITQLKVSIRQYQQEAASVNKYVTENDDLRRKLAEQTQYRKNLEVKLKQLMEKYQFDGQMHGTQNEELHERVRVANEIIVSLEAKMKKLNTGGGHLPAALQKLREGNLAEMRKFQMATEATLSRNMNAIKGQIQDSSSAHQAIMMEKRAMEAKMREYTVKITEYEAKYKAMMAENQSLRREVETERSNAQMSVAAMQKKLTELQNHLMCHSKEFVNARDAQASLRTEIEAYRTLLDVEGGRLSSRASSRANSARNGFVNFSNSVSKSESFHQHSSSHQCGGHKAETFRAMRENGRLSAMSMPSPRGPMTPRSAGNRSGSRQMQTERIFYGTQSKPGWR